MTARQVINVGTNPNDFTGDSIRTAMQKANTNFEKLWDEKDEILRRLEEKTDATSVDLTDDNSGTVYANTDATAIVSMVLPASPSLGASFTFLVTNVVGFRIYGQDGAVIRINAAVTAVNGYIEATTVGHAVTLTAVATNLWFAHPITGSSWSAH